MSSADLYIDRVDFKRYLNHAECARCSFSSCEDFIGAMKRGEVSPGKCSFMRANKAYAFEAVRKIEETWPAVPLLTHPRPAVTGLFELNQPDDRSLVLVSGNNEYTEEVLLTVLSTTVCPFYVLFVDTGGNTVDMSMIYGTLTAEGISNALRAAGIVADSSEREILLPGLAASLRGETEALTGLRVRPGPVCAAELPLFLADIWISP